jgi:hypothetical protein
MFFSHAQVVFKTRQCIIQLDASGKLTSMKSTALRKEYLAPGETTSLLTIKKDGEILTPQGCTWKQKTG